VAQLYGLGAFAEQLLVHEHALSKIPVELPLSFAALLGCSVATGLSAVWNCARVTAGSSVAVIGCGGVGLNCIQGARIAGASPIVAIDILSRRLASAKRFGATRTVNLASSSGIAMSEFEGKFDFVFEAAGAVSAVEMAFRMIGRGGVAVIIGLGSPDAIVELPARLLIGRTIVGTSLGMVRPRLDLPAYAELAIQHRIDIESQVGRQFSLDEVEEAFTVTRNSDSGRNLITFGIGGSS
jgi:S-(hydroxymethyl)glutathione dehydrogenase/alcohol dehydrogenase